MAVCLDRNLSLIVIRRFFWDPHDPVDRRTLATVPEDRRYRVILSIRLLSKSHLAEASALPNWDRASIVQISDIEVSEWRTRKTVWMRRLVFAEEIEDSPASERSGYWAVTSPRRDLVSFRLPAFGEYTDIAERMLKALRMMGHELI